MNSKKVVTLLNQATTVSTGEIKGLTSGIRTLHTTVSGTGAVSATVEFYGSNLDDSTTGILLATSILSGTNKDNAGDSDYREYLYMWAKVTAISGTNAKVTATVGV